MKELLLSLLFSSKSMVLRERISSLQTSLPITILVLNTLTIGFFYTQVKDGNRLFE